MTDEIIYTCPAEPSLISLRSVYLLAGVGVRPVPWVWLQWDSSLKVIDEVAQQIERETGTRTPELVRVIGGRPVEFYAHWLIALRYARYMSRRAESELLEWHKHRLRG